jgi:transcriptional regulator with XRE-family HTH domain
MEMVLREWIDKQLNTRGWSIRELGRQTGIPPGDLSEMLNSKRQPSFRFFIEVSKIFGVSVDFLLQLGGMLPHREGELTFTELYELGKRFSPQERKELLDYADYLKGQMYVNGKKVNPITPEALKPMLVEAAKSPGVIKAKDVV